MVTTMKTKPYIIFSFCAAAALLMAACTPVMDAPKQGSHNDPTRPDAPPQVILVPNIPDGMSIQGLAISDEHLYATVRDQDQVYRIHIKDLKNLAITGNPVPYVKVPGASGIAADDRGGLFIGSTGKPKNGVLEHKWTDEQVIYFNHTSEWWHSRFQNNPAQKLFVAPRGSFDALAFYKDPYAANNKRFEGGLYYAGEYPLEGMVISGKRYTNTLGAVKNAIPEELNFLIELAMGNVSMDNIDIADIFKLKETIKVALNTDDVIKTDGSIDYLKLLTNNLFTAMITPGLEGPPIDFEVVIRLEDAFSYFWKDYPTLSVEYIALYGAYLLARALIGDEWVISIPMSPLYLKPLWGLHLATLWSPILLELEMSELLDLLYEQIGPNGELIQQVILDGINDAIGSDDWWGTIVDFAAYQIGAIAKNTVNPKNIAALLSNYTDDYASTTRVAINNYKDQPGQYPPRPYLLPDFAGAQLTPYDWHITNLSAMSPRPPFLGYPMTPNFSTEVENAANLKIALTLYLLRFEDGNGGEFSLIGGPEQFDQFMEALNEGDILDKMVNVVAALDLDLVKEAIDNDQIKAYIDFIEDVIATSSSGIDIMATLSGLGTLLNDWGVTIDFRELLEAWWHLPDWEDIQGTQAGWIIDHNMLGFLYQAIDGFTEDLSGLWETLAGWVTSKIPRVNSAQGWSYGVAPNNRKPTGIAFGRDIKAGGIVGWVVDGGRLYSQRTDLPSSYLPYNIRDDYPWSNADGSEPYELINDKGEVKRYYKPDPNFWKQVDRGRWELVNIPGAGQTPTVVPQSMVLSDCEGVVYDHINNRVLVSCYDSGSQNKGRIVSVQYNGAVTTAYGPYSFVAPPPRISFENRYEYETKASFEVHEFIPADGELNHPTGMAIKDDYLFIADGNRIVVYYMGK